MSATVKDAPTRKVRSPKPAARIFAADQKSTRLNSSHITISYAVFCLKKKVWHDLCGLWPGGKADLFVNGVLSWVRGLVVALLAAPLPVAPALFLKLELYASQAFVPWP